MRKALIVGIDDYEGNPLTGSVADANAVATTLNTNGDGSPNFENVVMTSATGQVTRANLRAAIQRLFEGDSDIALFYFSGHGTITATGGIIVTQDGQSNDEGISMDDITTIANASGAKNKILILDCCNSGATGSPQAIGGNLSQLNDGLTVLTASRNWEQAVEVSGEGGVFTTLLVEALQGGAADVRGNITPGSLYAYVDEALGAWDQRPVFKTNVSSFARIRQVPPKVPFEALRRITDYFPSASDQHQLDPSYEPERNGTEPEGTPPSDPAKTAIFKELQAMESASLVVPVDAPHMWHAAMESKACKLTAMGRQYWRLAHEGKI